MSHYVFFFFICNVWMFDIYIYIYIEKKKKKKKLRNGGGV
jgi:hypothetical protein